MKLLQKILVAVSLANGMRIERDTDPYHHASVSFDTPEPIVNRPLSMSQVITDASKTPAENPGNVVVEDMHGPMMSHSRKRRHDVEGNPGNIGLGVMPVIDVSP